MSDFFKQMEEAGFVMPDMEGAEATPPDEMDADFARCIKAFFDRNPSDEEIERLIRQATPTP